MTKCPAIRRVSQGFAVCGEEDGHEGPHKDAEGQVYWENLKLNFIAPLNEPVIHILRHGRALCGMPGLPKDWPKDHKWVAFDDTDNLPEATCQSCRKAHDKPKCTLCGGKGWLYDADDAEPGVPCSCTHG